MTNINNVFANPHNAPSLQGHVPREHPRQGLAHFQPLDQGPPDQSRR